MKVVPSLSTALVKLKDAIEFFDGCSTNTPTWHASYRCFTATPTEGYPQGGEFVGRVSLRSETRRCKGTQGFRQVRAAESVIPYILCGLYCLWWWLFSRGVPIRPYIVWRDRFTWKS
jgi:hypothetical protein